jgi:MoaA/NifB/PqqE/SkfB family radical SAM enzyme
MEMDTFYLLLKRLTPYRPHVALNMGGESMLHPELPLMVRELKAVGMYVFVDTNATRLTPEVSNLLLDAGIDEMVVCLDGDSAAVYEAMRARANFDQVVANIQHLLRRRHGRASSTKVIIKNIRYYNPDDRPGFPDVFRSLFRTHPPDEYRFTWADHWPGMHRFRMPDAYAVQPYGTEYHPCINLWKLMAIGWDGQVFICCLDLERTTPIGDLRTMELMDIWNAPRMQVLRRVHRRGEQAQLPLCGTCNQIRRQPERRRAGLWSPRIGRFTPWTIDAPREALQVLSDDD